MKKRLPGKKWFTWPHLAGLLITAGLFYFIFQKIPAGDFWASIRHLDPGWFLVGLLIYGGALIFGATRWHLALHLTHRAVHFMASCVRCSARCQRVAPQIS